MLPLVESCKIGCLTYMKNSNANTGMLFNMQRDREGHITNRELFTFHIMRKVRSTCLVIQHADTSQVATGL
jgi:hypothetical protein